MIEYALALSFHLGLKNDYNSVHPHIRYTDKGFIAGVYYNSEDNISFYAGQRWEHEGVGFEAGAVTGYSGAPIVPYGRVTYNNFFAAPAIEKTDTVRVGVVLGYEIKF